MLLSGYLCTGYEETSLHIGSFIVPDGCLCRGRSLYCCCARCETAQACCTNGCAKCHKSHKTSHKPEKSCKDEGCTATFYKVDLVKYSCESPVITVPVIQLFCEVLPDFQYSLPTRELKEASYAVPPHPDSSRQYLALYSVLII